MSDTRCDTERYCDVLSALECALSAIDEHVALLRHLRTTTGVDLSRWADKLADTAREARKMAKGEA
jgi:hypothetical protein